MHAPDRPEPFGPVPPLTASYWLTCRAADSVIEAGLQLRHEAMLGRRWQRYAEALEVAHADEAARRVIAQEERDREAADRDQLRELWIGEARRADLAAKRTAAAEAALEEAARDKRIALEEVEAALADRDRSDRDAADAARREAGLRGVITATEARAVEAETDRDAHRAESNWLRGLLDEAEARAARAGHMADLLAAMYGQALAALVRCRGGAR